MTREEIVAECLTALDEGRLTVEECVRRYPTIPELEALLMEAQALRALRSLTPTPAANRRMQADLRRRFVRAQTPRRRPGWGLAWRWALALVALVLLGSTGVTLTAQASLPGEPLYPLKRAAEDVRVGLTSAPELPTFYMALAQQRLIELETMLSRQSLTPEIVAELTAEVDGYTATSLQLARQLPPPRRAETLRILVEDIDEQHLTLTRVRLSAPVELHAQLDGASISIQAHHTEADHELETLTLTGPGTATAPAVNGSPIAATATLEPPATQAASATTGPTLTATLAPSLTPLPTDTAAPTEASTDTPPAPTFTPPAPTATPPGQSNCQAHNPNSPRYCTPTPAP
jgi:hypothetical protein